jgi:hypothetical protein
MKTGLEHYTDTEFYNYEIGVLNARKQALQNEPEQRQFIYNHFDKVLQNIEVEKKARKQNKK